MGFGRGGASPGAMLSSAERESMPTCPPRDRREPVWAAGPWRRSLQTVPLACGGTCHGATPRRKKSSRALGTPRPIRPRKGGVPVQPSPLFIEGFSAGRVAPISSRAGVVHPDFIGTWPCSVGENMKARPGAMLSSAERESMPPCLPSAKSGPDHGTAHCKLCHPPMTIRWGQPEGNTIWAATAQHVFLYRIDLFRVT